MSLTRVIVSCSVVGLLLASAPALVAQNNQNRSRQEQQDIEAALKIVDGVAAGAQPAPADIPITWDSNHFFKGANDLVYMPYTLNVDASALSAPGVALYVRVVSKTPAPAPTPAADARNNDRDRQAPAVTYPWAQVYFIEVKGNAKVSRPMQLRPGQYEVFVLVKERTPPQQARNAPPQKVGLLRHDLTVPNFSGPALTTSSVLVTTAITPLTAPLTAEQQDANPYALGGFSVVPSADGRVRKNGEMQVLFFIYGAGNNGGKPNVQVEYNFHTRTADGEKYFNKMAPQDLNAQTLPPQFDLNAGHQLFSIVDLPLAAFPEGDYRLEIKVTDKLGGGTLTENATFSVIAG